MKENMKSSSAKTEILEELIYSDEIAGPVMRIWAAYLKEEKEKLLGEAAGERAKEDAKEESKEEEETGRELKEKEAEPSKGNTQQRARKESKPRKGRKVKRAKGPRKAKLKEEIRNEVKEMPRSINLRVELEKRKKYCEAAEREGDVSITYVKGEAGGDGKEMDMPQPGEAPGIKEQIVDEKSTLKEDTGGEGSESPAQPCELIEIGGPAKEEEESKAKSQRESFDNILPTKDELEKAMEQMAPLFQEAPAQKKSASATCEKAKDLPRIPRRERGKAVRASQSFVGLNPEELREKNHQLNELIRGLKMRATQTQQRGEKAAEPTSSPNEAGLDDYVEATKENADDYDALRKRAAINKLESEKAVEAGKIEDGKRAEAEERFVPAVDSSDDDNKDPRFAKKSWANSPSLPEKLLAQNEAQADKIFGPAASKAVNLQEIFYGWKDLPPDSPNKFVEDDKNKKKK